MNSVTFLKIAHICEDHKECQQYLPKIFILEEFDCINPLTVILMSSKIPAVVLHNADDADNKLHKTSMRFHTFHSQLKNFFVIAQNLLFCQVELSKHPSCLNRFHWPKIFVSPSSASITCAIWINFAWFDHYGASYRMIGTLAFANMFLSGQFGTLALCPFWLHQETAKNHSSTDDWLSWWTGTREILWAISWEWINVIVRQDLRELN